MSAPLDGDRLAIEAWVGDGARLTVGSAAATIALPGPGPAAEPATYDIELSVGEQGGLCQLPEQPVSAHGSALRMTTRVELAPTARLVLREEQILGRHGERTGTFTSRLTVRRAGRPLIDQQVAYGPGAPQGRDGAVVLGGHRAVGQLLVVDLAFSEKCPEARLLGPTAVLTPLAGPGVLVTAVAPDARLLRRALNEALNDVLHTPAG
ncbi:urease accessory protein UreD [Streptomyces sp. NBC_01618]|uniref:urease accessory protein UreD n=1 Tax=Streptomyces sp. NBC_01618 TaxID=2975900 RepID=UPI003866BA40